MTTPRRSPSPRTVGRGKPLSQTSEFDPGPALTLPSTVKLHHGDSLSCYADWPTPTVIVSDGAYGILGFDGDTADHHGVQDWYAPHVEAWTRQATSRTTLWFWNSEIGWAMTHPLLERHGWRYVNANVWDKGLGHIAGNVNTAKIRRFPVVTELCVQYVLDPTIQGLPLKRWLKQEWQRTGLPMRQANDACGVRDAATRKYLDQGYLWYCPPPDVFARLADYANTYGDPAGRPYFSKDGQQPLTAEAWDRLRPVFRCPHGVTNVWHRPSLKGSERLVTQRTAVAHGGATAHLNQKPLDLMTRLIETSSDPDDVIWEPFGGLFSASLAAHRCGRRAYGAELDAYYYGYPDFRAECCKFLCWLRIDLLNQHKL